MHPDAGSSPKLQELLGLVCLLSEDGLTDDQAGRLNELVCGQPSMRQAYVDLVDMLACLQWGGAASNDAELGRQNVAVLFPEICENSNEPQSHFPSKPFPAINSLFGRLSLNSRWLGFAASVLIFGYFGFLAVLVMSDRGEQPPRSLANKPFVTLVSTTDCRWKQGSHFLEEGVSLGAHRLELIAGTAELVFSDGARVVLEGPSCLVPQCPGRVLLEYGKLAAQIPRRAVGFTVITPTTEIVDFGTEFGVAVSQGGLVEAAVLAGKVEVGAAAQPKGHEGKQDKRNRILTAGQAVTAHLDAGRLAIDSVDFNEVMRTSLAKPFESLAQLPARAVAYGVPDRTSGDRADFNGGIGLDFDVTSPIRILSLGVFDHLSDGLDHSSSPIVQLWRRNNKGTPDDASDDLGREILASQEFTSEDAGELRMGHRFKPLAKFVELPVGSYSVVAYGLHNQNPFLGVLKDSMQVGSVVALNKTVMNGQAGGTFARNDNESYFGDTKLDQAFTLSSNIAASGTFAFLNAKHTHHGKCFVGHFSQSTADNRREFIGAEFGRGEVAGMMSVRARIYRFDGDTPSDASSQYVNLSSVGSRFHFDYNYDPNYEADSDHAGPEGRLTLRIYNDKRTVDETVYAVNAGTHRDADSTFDAFGMGVATMQSMKGDDPASISELFIDDVAYSGHNGVVDFNSNPDWIGVGNDNDGNRYGWSSEAGDPGEAKAQKSARNRESGIAVFATGSRIGDGQSGTFPGKSLKQKIGAAAGSFEYLPLKK